MVQELYSFRKENIVVQRELVTSVTLIVWPEHRLLDVESLFKDVL